MFNIEKKKCWKNVDKHKSAQLSFSTKFQRWNNVGSLTLIRRNSIDVVSTLFVNVETTAINVRSLNSHFQRWFNVDVFSGKYLIFHLFWSYDQATVFLNFLNF